MRSQIIPALLATAISAAPVLNTGDAKNSQLSKREAEPGKFVDVDILEGEDASSSQSTKREAQPGSAVIGDLIGEDASDETLSKRSPGAVAQPT